MKRKTKIYFTVDTESSLGGAWQRPDRRPLDLSRRVFCRIGGEEFGIPLLARIMGEFGFCGTYFVETLATRCLGQDEMKSIFDFLLWHGQDIQLHAHPGFWFYSELQDARRKGAPYSVCQPADMIGHYAPDAQMVLLSEGICFFEALAGYRPTAFRAGNYAGSRSMMRCLRELGICLDSSFNPCYHPETSFPGDRLEPNRIQNIEGVWEFPVTVARTRLPEGHKGFKFADCAALSFAEVRTMLEAAWGAGQEHFVMVFHSFSAVKARDETYAGMRPNWIVIQRLQKLFRYIAENPDKFSFDTLGNAARHTELLKDASKGLIVPELGVRNAIKRKAVQLFNRAYWT
jgi:hypothetical protein